jgi:ribosomal protein S18 acetylase RimI-like enzyme
MTTVTLRNEDPAIDEPFIRRLVTDTLALEFGAAAWPELLRSQVLELQYATRRQGPRANFPEGESRVILIDGEPAGWMFTAEFDDHIHVAEIMVLPEHRGKGAGSAVLQQMLDAAARDRKAVRLHVNVLNAGAIRLYQRLGFQRTGGNEVQHDMEAQPYSHSQRSMRG